MKTINILSVAILSALLLAACGSDNSEKAIDKKKAELEKKRTELNELRNEILNLEKELAELDPTFGKNDNNVILVSTSAISTKPFEHRVEVRGTVQSRKNIVLSAESMGRIVSVNVTEGQNVSQGQVLLVLNADVLLNNIEEVKTQLALANSIFERQANLWKKNIGSEVQYLEAKTRKESLERSLATLNSQLEQTKIRAPFSGTIDQVIVNAGEMATMGMPLIRMVKLDDMYIQSDVSEVFIGKFKSGDAVKVYFPSQGKEIVTQVAAVSQVINNQNRTFSVEVRLPATDFTVKPNQVAVLSLRDYYNESAKVLPTAIIQKDDVGNFVYQVKNVGGKKIASKLHIGLGLSFEGSTEVSSGIDGTELIVDKGFRELSNGIEVKTTDMALGANK